jgi:hypothetical protein
MSEFDVHELEEKKKNEHTQPPASVVIEASTPKEALKLGAHLLGLNPEAVEYEEISAEGEKIKARIFPKGASVPWEEREDGSFCFVNMDDGLYLIVSPPKGEGKSVSESKVLHEIEEMGYEGVDYELVKKAVDESADRPVRVGPRQYEPELDGRVIVKVPKDGQKALMILVPPKEGGREVDFEDVMKELREKGVIIGIKEDVIRAALKEKRFNESIKVAEYIPPTKGESACFEYQFGVKNDEVERAVPGQLLMVKRPPTLGKPGKKVTGEEIPPLQGDDFNVIPGRNIKLSQDGTRAYATDYGEVYWTGYRVSVDKVYRIRGDVNSKLGNIDFPGKVVVSGSVEDDMVIKAGGDVEIEGGVGKASIEAGGDIYINQGVVGKGGAEISASGDIIARFVQDASLKARGDVVVSELIMRCNVIAGRKVMVHGARGLIVGGEIFAGEEIDSKEIGSRTRIQTKVKIGVMPGTQEKISKLKILKAEYEEKLKRTSEKREKNEIEGRLKVINEKLAWLQSLAMKSEKGKISALYVIHPEVRIVIGHTGVQIVNPCRAATFLLDSDKKIKQEPYRGSLRSE